MAIQRKIVTVVFNDGHQEQYRMTPLAEMKAERVWKMSVGKLDTSTQISQLAWTCAEVKAKETGAVIKSLEAWLEDVEVIDVDTEDINPTDAAPSEDGPPNSQSQPESHPES